jgi:hypothetical protein
MENGSETRTIDRSPSITNSQHAVNNNIMHQSINISISQNDNSTTHMHTMTDDEIEAKRDENSNHATQNPSTPRATDITDNRRQHFPNNKITSESLYHSLPESDTSFVFTLNQNKSKNIKPLALNKNYSNTDLRRYIQNVMKVLLLKIIEPHKIENLIPNRVELRKTSNSHTNRFILYFDNSRQTDMTTLKQLLLDQKQIIRSNKEKVITGIVGPINPILSEKEVHNYFEKCGFIGSIKLLKDGGIHNIGKAKFEILESNIHLIQDNKIPGFSLHKPLYFLQKRQPKLKICFVCRKLNHTSHDCSFASLDKKDVPQHCYFCGNQHEFNGLCPQKCDACIACGSTDHNATRCPDLKITYHPIVSNSKANKINTPTINDPLNFPSLSNPVLKSNETHPNMNAKPSYSEKVKSRSKQTGRSTSDYRSKTNVKQLVKSYNDDQISTSIVSLIHDAFENLIKQYIKPLEKLIETIIPHINNLTDKQLQSNRTAIFDSLSNTSPVSNNQDATSVSKTNRKMIAKNKSSSKRKLKQQAATINNAMTASIVATSEDAKHASVHTHNTRQSKSDSNEIAVFNGYSILTRSSLSQSTASEPSKKRTNKTHRTPIQSSKHHKSKSIDDNIHNDISEPPMRQPNFDDESSTEDESEQH